MRIAVVLVAALMGSAAWADDQSGTLQYPATYFEAARPQTAYDMVSRLPGFVFDDGQSARGFAGTAGNVLIDGQRPTSKTDDLQSILQRIPAGDVDRVEVIRGGAQGIDMHGQSVVANVVRKKSDSTQIVMDIDSHFWPDGHMLPEATLQFTRHAGESTYEFSVLEFANYDDSVGTGFYDVTDTVAGTVQHFDMHKKAMAFGWGVNGAATVPLWGGQFKANATYRDSPFSSRNTFFAPGNDWAISDGTGAKKGEVGLHWIGPVGDGLEFETLALQRLGRSTDRQVSSAVGDNEVFWYRARTAESIARATLRWRPSDALTIEGGSEGAYNLLDGESTYHVNGTAVPLPSANVRVDEKRGEVFAQAMWTITPQWKLEAGARAEYSVISETGDSANSRTFFYPKPRVLVTWSPLKDTQVRLRYERVLGQLDFSNFVASSSLGSTGVAAGNPDLSPDRHSQYEISVEQHFWDKGAVVLTLTHDDVSGVMDYIPVMGSSGLYDAPGNIGGGHKNLIDLEVTLPLDKLGLTNGLLKATQIWRLTGVRDPATGTTRAFSGIRPRVFQYTLTQDIDSLKSTWGVFFFTGWDERYYRPTQFEHAKVIPPYVELNWDYKPTTEWMFSVAVKNAIPFGYDDVNVSYPGLRGATDPSGLTEFKVKSQARLYLEIRRTL
jgi:outer membrane receptor protein involved in Fe transport